MSIPLYTLTFSLLLVCSISSSDETTHRPIFMFHRQQANALFKEHRPAVMLLLGDLDQSEGVFTAVSELPAEYPGYLFTYSKKGFEPYLKLIELVGVDKMAPPVLLVFNANTDKFLYRQEEFGSFTADNIRKFIKKVEKGDVGIFLRSGQSIEDIPAEERQKNQQYMTYFTAYSLQQARRTTDKNIVLVVYASWCLYSQQFAPMYRDIAQRLHNETSLWFGKLEGPGNEIRGFETAGFPSILFWGRDKQAEPKVYYGDRSVKDVIGWIQELITPHEEKSKEKGSQVEEQSGEVEKLVEVQQL